MVGWWVRVGATGWRVGAGALSLGGTPSEAGSRWPELSLFLLGSWQTILAPDGIFLGRVWRQTSSPFPSRGQSGSYEAT